MSNYRIKVKINDYFPKIDAIPFENYLCIISCNNSYSNIKLTEYKYQFFQHTFKLIKNTDILFKIKLINYLDKNTIIGIYDLLIPDTKVNQILKRNTSFYQQQIKLIMNSNVKIKLFGTMMNITSIYLDLIFEISLIENYTPSINKLRIYDIIENKDIEEIMNNHYKKVKDNNNLNRNIQLNIQKYKIAKSPKFNNSFMYNLYDNESNINKEYCFNSSNTHKEKHSDINYNVMNNNYLNYFNIDNNNFPVNYKFDINNKSPMNILKKDINNIEANIPNNIYIKLNSINNLSIPREKKYVKINNNKNNIKGLKRNENKARSPYSIYTERNSYIDESNKYIKNSRNQNLTEAQSSIESDIIRKEKKKLELIQNKKINKFQNIDNRIIKINNINKLDYMNYIKNKMPLIYDKKNHLQIFNNRLRKKIPNSNKCFQNKNIKSDIYGNKMDLSELKPNKTFVYKLTPKKQKLESNSYIIKENENNTFINYTSNIKKIKEVANELNNIEDKKLSIKNNIPLQNSNLQNLKNYFEKTKLDDENDAKDIKNDRILISDENLNDLSNNKNNLSNNKNIFYNNICENKNKENNNNEDKYVEDKIENKKIMENIENKDIIKSNISNENKEKINNINNDLSPEEFIKKLLESMDINNKLTKEIKDKIDSNYNLFKKLLLYKEKYFTELKINNCLKKNINLKDIKYLIHVNIRSKLNEKLYFNFKKIKIKEFKIFEKIFYEHKNSSEYKIKEAKRKIQEKLEQQKKVHALLKIIRELIQKYENLSQIYNEDHKKKLLFKSLLVRYGIREKEESKENNLIDKFKEIKKKIEEEKNNNFMKIKKKEIENEIYKNAIREESDEERSSISERMLKRGYSFKKKLSWASEDSVFKEKENLESNKNNNDEINNSLLSSGLKIIRENKEEEKDNINNEDDLKKEKNNINGKEELIFKEENNICKFKEVEKEIINEKDNIKEIKEN